MAARSKPVELLKLQDLNILPDHVGFVGARQQVVSVQQLPTRGAGELITDDGRAHERIIAALKAWGAR
jgi:electron transfer flavoprotein alpha/beta subunit